MKNNIYSYFRYDTIIPYISGTYEIRSRGACGNRRMGMASVDVLNELTISRKDCYLLLFNVTQKSISRSI